MTIFNFIIILIITLIKRYYTFVLQDLPTEESSFRYGYTFMPILFTSNGIYKIKETLEEDDEVEPKSYFKTNSYSSNLITNNNEFAMLFVEKPTS